MDASQHAIGDRAAGYAARNPGAGFEPDQLALRTLRGRSRYRHRVGFTIRPFRSADAAAVLAAFADPEMVRQGDVADLDQAAAWISAMAPDQPDRYVFAIDLDGVAIGAVGVTAIDWDNRTGWFWYWCHRSHRGRGTTSRAAATVANWALRQCALERLELGHRVNNPASAGVARAAGFVREGVERGKFLIAGTRVDVITYGRLITDPIPLTETFELRE